MMMVVAPSMRPTTLMGPWCCRDYWKRLTFCSSNCARFDRPCSSKQREWRYFQHEINGHYVMLGSTNSEPLFVMYSELLYFWYTKKMIIKPTNPWELFPNGKLWVTD